MTRETGSPGGAWSFVAISGLSEAAMLRKVGREIENRKREKSMEGILALSEGVKLSLSFLISNRWFLQQLDASFPQQDLTSPDVKE